MSLEIPLPDVEEQRRVVARIEAVAARVEAVRALRAAHDADASALLLRSFRDVSADAPRRAMGEVAPLVRRPVEVEDAAEYQELGIRSFGRGTFEKPPTTGAELGGKRVFWIKEGDLLFSNVFAWEGAVAVATSEDEGRIGSHRFMTCVCDSGLAHPAFLQFYFTTPGGLGQLGEASPGGAGRNRTLGVEALARIAVPVPPVEAQQAFLRLAAQVETARRHAAASDLDLSALLASTLAAAFSGRL